MYEESTNRNEKERRKRRKNKNQLGIIHQSRPEDKKRESIEILSDNRNVM